MVCEALSFSQNKTGQSIWLVIKKNSPNDKKQNQLKGINCFNYSNSSSDLNQAATQVREGQKNNGVKLLTIQCHTYLRLDKTLTLAFIVFVRCMIVLAMFTVFFPCASCYLSWLSYAHSKHVISCLWS